MMGMLLLSCMYFSNLLFSKKQGDEVFPTNLTVQAADTAILLAKTVLRIVAQQTDDDLEAIESEDGGSGKESLNEAMIQSLDLLRSLQTWYSSTRPLFVSGSKYLSCAITQVSKSAPLGEAGLRLKVSDLWTLMSLAMESERFNKARISSIITAASTSHLDVDDVKWLQAALVLGRYRASDLFGHLKEPLTLLFSATLKV